MEGPKIDSNFYFKLVLLVLSPIHFFFLFFVIHILWIKTLRCPFPTAIVYDVLSVKFSQIKKKAESEKPYFSKIIFFFYHLPFFFTLCFFLFCFLFIETRKQHMPRRALFEKRKWCWKYNRRNFRGRKQTIFLQQCRKGIFTVQRKNTLRYSRYNLFNFSFSIIKSNMLYL